MLWATTVLPWFSHGSVLGDVTIYRGWAKILATGSYPVHDTQWQYPPAAALVFLIPQLFTHFGISYLVAFFFLALAADFAVFVLLLGHAHRISAADGVPGDGQGSQPKGLLAELRHGPTIGRIDIPPAVQAVRLIMLVLVVATRSHARNVPSLSRAI